MWRLPLAGGNWNNESNAGLAYLNLNNPRSNVNNNIGFRPALQRYLNQYLYGDIDMVRMKRSRIPSRKGKHEQGNVSSRPMPTAALLDFFKRTPVHTVNGLWDSVVDYESLYRAYLRASKGKRYSFESMKFRENLEENLIGIQHDLTNRTYHPMPLRQFTVWEPKERLISAPHFHDRIVHHSLVAAIEPHFERRFIQDSFACRKGKGTHAAMLRMRQFCRAARRTHGNYWVLKCDIKKFFPSIDHTVLKAIIRKTIRDKRTLWLCDTIIDSFGDGKGLPIGALTSQLFANVVLDPLDHYIKDQLGIALYVRYMDDFCVLGHSKNQLQELLKNIGSRLTTMKLELNHRTGIWPCRHGVDFCGYRIWSSHTLPRKKTVKRIKRDLKGIIQQSRADERCKRVRVRLVSFLGYIKHCNGYRITLSVLDKGIIKAG